MDSVTKQAGSSRDFSVCQLLYCAVLLAGIHLYLTTEVWMCLQCDAPCHDHLTKPLFFFFFLQVLRDPGCANLLESCAFSQSSHGCNYKLNTVAWLVELTYMDTSFTFVRSLLSGLGKARFTLTERTLTLTESVEVILVTSVEQLI